MKILVLNNDLMERTVIQQVLQYNKHEIIPAQNSETAIRLLQQGGIRFVIADRATTDIDEQQFIKRLRNANPPYYIYILLTASKVSDTDVTAPNAGADDYLHKPIVPLELKSRVHIGERILGLGDNLLQARDALAHTAMFDPLTKMLNQTAFLNLSRGELERARRTQAPLSLIALNIENHDDIHEKYGKEIGDDALVLISQAIREKSRPYDGVGRYEKALFLLPLPGVIGQDAEKIAERIRKGILSTDITMLDGTPLNMGVNLAVVSCVRITAATEIEAMIEKAREALSDLKRDGTDQTKTVFM